MYVRKLRIEYFLEKYSIFFCMETSHLLYLNATHVQEKVKVEPFPKIESIKPF